MAKAAARTGGGFLGWRLIAILVMLAFTFQSFVAQTHIHESAPPASIQLIKDLGHNKSPVDNSPLDCPFCQAVAHDGLFFVPDAPVLFLVAQWVEMAAPHFFLADHSADPNHNWRSRAPPTTDR
ncbi:MAG TPA: hypothetical protein VG501_02730 [Rhizomicrobium sp.]|nr:hypothetical protein [Rhizomicrobium sp.]